MANQDDFQYEYFSSVKQREVEWLWYPYIPYGKLTILQGDPGEGKSTFILNIAALLSKGKSMPDGYRVPTPEQVIYQTGEDNIADTVKPRLIRAGADCEKIAYIVDEEATLTLEDTRIESVISETGARLFILDPLQAYLSQESDMQNAGRMRQQLRKLADIAAKYRCAIVIIGHMNKASGEKNLYRGLGSIDIPAIARSVLMISRDKKNPDLRIMFPVKSSLAPSGPPVAFKLERDRGINWHVSQADIRPDVIARASNLRKSELTRRTMLEMLEERDVPGTQIVRKLHIMGISERTARNIKKELGISSYKKDMTWYWHYDGRFNNKEDS